MLGMGVGFNLCHISWTYPEGMGPDLAVTASEVVLYPRGSKGAPRVMSDLDKLKAGAQDVVGKTKSWLGKFILLENIYLGTI